MPEVKECGNCRHGAEAMAEPCFTCKPKDEYAFTNWKPRSSEHILAAKVFASENRHNQRAEWAH